MFTSNNDSKKEFIAKAKIERENREKERLFRVESERRENAAIVLQRWWQKRRTTRQARIKIWEEWNQLISVNDATILDIYQISGIYCFLTRTEKQPSRLKQLVRCLISHKFSSAKGSDTRISFYALLIDVRYMEKTREYLEVIINQCLSQCAALSDGNGSFGPELTFLLQYLNPSTYKTKNIIDPVYLIDLHNPILQSVAQCILKSTLCQFQLRDCFLRYVQQIVKNQNHSLQQDKQKLNATILWLTTMTRLTLYPIEHAELTSDSLDMATASMFLWTNTLAVPGIISIVSSTKMIVDRLKKWTLGAVTPFLLNSTNKNVCMDRLGGNGCLFLLGNIIDLWGDNGGDQMELVNLISSFLQYIKKYFSDKQTTLFPNRHPVFKWSNAKWGNTLSFSVFERVIKQMEYIWSRPFMDQLFYDIIHFDFNTVDTPKRSLFSIKLGKRIVQEKASSGGKMALFSMEIESVFSMYSSLISTFKSQSNVILYRIAFTKDLMSQLWKVMNLFGPKGNMQIYLDASKRSDISKEPLIKVLMIFCQACSIMFLTLDDSDIFQHHTPFSPDDLVWMSGFLNSFYFSLIQQQTSIPTELPLAAVSFKSARRLLLQIYDLDLHHPFCPPNHWLLISGMSNRMKSLVSSVFTKEESSGSLFLSNLSQGDPVPLRILQLMPHTVPFNVRLKAFRDWIALDRSSTKKTQSTLITVRRHGVLLDGYQQLSSLSASAWKGDIRVSFMNEIGMDRVGVNQGRPLKDFVTMLISEVFRPNHGLFAATEQNSFYPNPYSSVYGKNHIQLFEFIGKVIGKSLYEGILLDVRFTIFLLAKLLGRDVFLEGLKELDKDVWKTLLFLKHYQGDVEELGLTFKVDEQVSEKVETHELKFRGKDTSVTNQNKIEYVYLMADYKLNHGAKEQTNAFIHGFRTVVSENWIKLFSPSELQRVLTGDNKSFGRFRS